MKIIFVAINYVLELVEVDALSSNTGKSVTIFLNKNIFSRFKIIRVIISDGGSEFFNILLKGFLEKYNVKHKVATPYNPHINRQVGVSNCEINSILAKYCECQ